MVTVNIKGTACDPYNTYTIVTTNHGITAMTRQLYHSQGSYTMGEYEMLVYIVQATYAIALSCFIRIVHSRRAFKLQGEAKWFKCPPLVYNSNKPLKSII